jgi:hypothetical protein
MVYSPQHGKVATIKEFTGAPKVVKVAAQEGVAFGAIMDQLLKADPA